MRLKLDEDLPRAAAELLRARGYDCHSVLDERLGGTKDARLWTLIQAEGRFLITADKGFANIREHPPGEHEGVLLLRPAEDGIDPVLNLLEDVLQRVDLRALRGNVAVASPRGLRIRRAGS